MSPFDAERLLAEVGWVRQLARSLSRDESQADDLAQETLVTAVAALESDRTGPRGSLRAWLRGVLRNVLRSSRRREHHRSAREAAVSRSERTPATAELVERAAVQRSLVGHLLELEEPFRETLLLRFFDELSNEEIARRLGVPASTVSSRVARGLGHLRERLRQQHGDARTWLTALLPLREWTPRSLGLPKAVPVAPTLTGSAILMSTQAKLLLSAGALVGAFFVVRSIGDRPQPGVTPVEVDAPVVQAMEPAAPRKEPDPVSTRPTAAGRVAQPAPVASAPVASAPVADAVELAATRLLSGRVVDLEGGGVAGVRVELSSLPANHRGGAEYEHEELVSALTGADGRFEFLAPEAGRIVRVEDQRYTTVLASHVPVEGPHSDPVREGTELVVVVAWSVTLAGVVVDEAGQPIEGASFGLGKPDLSGLQGLVLDRSVALQHFAETDAEGRFRLTGVPEVQGFLTAHATGFARWYDQIPAGGDEHLEIVLRKRVADPTRIAGRVLLPNGEPAVEAYVSAAMSTQPDSTRPGGAIAVQTDGEGRFVLDPRFWMQHDILPADEPLTLWAVLSGFGPAQRALPALAVGDAGGWPEELVLVLTRVDADASALAGRVVDLDGNPLPDVTVDLLDQTPFGQVPAEGRGTSYYGRSLEDMLAGSGPSQTSDAEGRFRFQGLPDRPYRLQALQADTLLNATTEPIEVGRRDVEIVLDTSRLGTLAGRLIDATGAPIPEVRVSVSHMSPQAGRFGGNAVTDADGAFRIEGTATEEVTLSFSGETIVPALKRALPEGQDVDDLLIVVGLRCYLQLDWKKYGHTGAEVSVLDAHDEPIDLYHIRGQSWGHQRTAPVYGERSDVFVLPDHSTWLRVMQAGEEVERLPLRLEPGEVTQLEL